MSNQPAPAEQIPVFPLGTVLFPGGVLPLRIFEARYMDMVRNCLKNGTRFGVCLITDGAETGSPASHETAGCAARIDQWDMEQLGLLNIRTIGCERFDIVDSELQSDGLRIASVQFQPADEDMGIPPDCAPCVALLQRIVDDLAAKETDPVRQMIQPPCQFDSASWVSNRLCEFLPIPNPAKHQLMMLNDPLVRLTAVHRFLREQSVI